MDDKTLFFQDISTLVKMCNVKSEGSFLKFEYDELFSKYNDIEAEIDDIKKSISEECYDTSAEMADRNIEIILKKIINNLNISIREKRESLENFTKKSDELKEEIALLEEKIFSEQNYLSKMQKFSSVGGKIEILDSSFSDNVYAINKDLISLEKELKEKKKSFLSIQVSIRELSDDLNSLAVSLKNKKGQLIESRNNLKNKEAYIDFDKRSRNRKKIASLTAQKEELSDKMSKIVNNPAYIEYQIKECAKKNLFGSNQLVLLVTRLIKIALSYPFMTFDLDNALESKLLRATQARDTLADIIEKKSYSVFDTLTPESIRICYLNNEIEQWEKDKENLLARIKSGNENAKITRKFVNDLNDIISRLKKEIKEYSGLINDDCDEADSKMNSMNKANLELRQKDLKNAEDYLIKFYESEANNFDELEKDLNIKYKDIQNKIDLANEEIEKIKYDTLSNKDSAINLIEYNNDKKMLSKLADIVVKIKHRQQFLDSPLTIAKRLEVLLETNLLDDIKVNTSDDIFDEELINSIIGSSVEENNEELEESFEDKIKLGKIIKVVKQTPLIEKNDNNDEIALDNENQSEDNEVLDLDDNSEDDDILKG